MRKLLYTFGVIVLLLLSFTIHMVFTKQDTVNAPDITPNQSTTSPNLTFNTEQIEQVKTTVMEETKEDFLNLQMGETFIYDNYAFQVWFDDNLGGEALLKKESDSWVLVSLGGGAWEDYGLVELGVPRDIATEMVRLRPY